MDRRSARVQFMLDMAIIPVIPAGGASKISGSRWMVFRDVKVHSQLGLHETMIKKNKQKQRVQQIMRTGILF